ncbi:MAG: hypothetical protein ACLR23_12065 [Clostridia bacterium]
MHAGEAGKGRGQRANGGKLRAGSVETSKAAGKQDKKCTPARREGQGPACKRRQNFRHHSRDVQTGGETGRKMHAGEARKGRGQRANGGKMPTVIVETSKAAGKQDKKCTPARRRQKQQRANEANCPPSTSRRPRRRGNGKKNARRRGGETKPACKRRQIAHRQRRDVQGGGETGRKMHAGEAKKERPACKRRQIARRHRRDRPRRGRNRMKNARRRGGEGRSQRANGGRLPTVNVETSKAAGKRDKNARRRGGEGRSQRANGGKLPAVNVETSKAAGKQEEKCTPARQRPAGASVQTEADCAPSQSRRPSWRETGKNARRRGEKGRSQRANGGKIPAVIVETAKPGRHGKKNARRRDEERQKPACKRRHNLRHHSQTSKLEGKQEKMHAGEAGPAGASVQTEQIARRQRRDVQGGGETG